MTDANKAIVRRLYLEAVNEGRLAVIDEVYAPDVEVHMPGQPEDPFGPGPIRQMFAMINSAFPGTRVSIEDVVAEGDKVVARVAFNQPHDGRFIGAGPQSRLVAWTRIDIFRLFNGRIIEQWADRDEVALLQQVGVAAPPLEPSVQIRARHYA